MSMSSTAGTVSHQISMATIALRLNGHLPLLLANVAGVHVIGPRNQIYGQETNFRLTRIGYFVTINRKGVIRASFEFMRE